MSIKDEIKLLNEKIKKDRTRLARLVDRINIKEEFPARKKLIGTVWAHRNSYSCPSEESDYWQILYYVERVDPAGTMHLRTLQKDKDGNWHFEKQGMYCNVKDSHVFQGEQVSISIWKNLTWKLCEELKDLIK